MPDERSIAADCGRSSVDAPLCDYCDLPAAYAICVERACEKHATPQLRKFAAMEIRRSSVGVDAYVRTDDPPPPEFAPTVGAVKAQCEARRLREALQKIVVDSRRPELADAEYLRGIALAALEARDG